MNRRDSIIAMEGETLAASIAQDELINVITSCSRGNIDCQECPYQEIENSENISCGNAKLNDTIYYLKNASTNNSISLEEAVELLKG